MESHPLSGLRFYVAELLILIIGITLSFLINEWRTNRQVRAVERTAILQVRDDLQADTAHMRQMLESIDTFLLQKQTLFDKGFQEDQPGMDTYLKVMTLQVFMSFRPRTEGYNELRWSTGSRTIRDRNLLNSIVNLYNSVFEIFESLNEADRVFVMTELSPFLSKRMPFIHLEDVPNSLTAPQRRKLMQCLQTDAFKHYVFLSLEVKRNYKGNLKMALQKTGEVLAQIEAHLDQH